MESLVERGRCRREKIMSLRLKPFFWSLISVFFPVLAMADESGNVSFSPPTSDISVTFLENIFGVVDGVLHGTGSQIVGAMFGVFNAAVLALGGIVIMYIILVSTMNTAHEGQMLGQKWSSIWVPTRACMGLALLIPKASGYCLMQIFVMWVVLQGVGVADKIWGTALSYLNRGGVIIQANMSPTISMNADSGGIMTGAATILYGQVCMEGLQTELETLRTSYLAAKEKDSGACAGSPSDDMTSFCEESVPSFLNTVSPLTAYDEQHDATGMQAVIAALNAGTMTAEEASAYTESFTLDMPNFDKTSLYNPLNGICGTIKWKGQDLSELASIQSSMSTISSSDIETIEKSRAAAIEQVYISLSTTAKLMVANDPQINSTVSYDDNASTVAAAQFGVPYTASQTVCQKLSDDCPNWGADASSSSPVLLDGTELQEAVADYNAVMAPTLKLIDDLKHANDASDERAFITDATSRGWIMAGSYFFDLARINGSASSSTLVDSSSGFGDSAFDVSLLSGVFSGTSCGDGTYHLLCDLFTINSPTPVADLVLLFEGTSDTGLSAPTFSGSSITNVSGTDASTVFGYANNAALIDLPEQEDISGPDINITAELDLSGMSFHMKDQKIKCSEKDKWMGIKWGCIVPNALNDAFKVFQNMIDTLVDAMITAVQWAYKIFVVYPLAGFVYIFKEGVDIIGQDGVNPIVALGKMGVTFIDFSMNIWVIAAAGAAIAWWAPSVYALYMIVAPLFLAWEGIMLGIGFLTAYYVPFLPYMIFTFGSIAWLISVIEAMVAAPIVALGVAHPEGHDALGKGEAGLMILLNVFLRPGMMVIGYITAISVSFVGIWIMNAGFENVLSYLESDDMWAATSTTSPIPWARFFGFFFSCMIYTMMYLTIVQKAFTLIAVLPDKVLRWIGGQPEQVGQETSQWGDETKGKIGEAGTKTGDAGGAMQKQMAGTSGDAASTKKKPESGKGDAQSKGGGDKPAGGSEGGGTTPPSTPSPTD